VAEAVLGPDQALSEISLEAEHEVALLLDQVNVVEPGEATEVSLANNDTATVDVAGLADDVLGEMPLLQAANDSDAATHIKA